ncbi:hypothetical protein BC832DRAFT_434011 [Gaertneriomyces semiglobifer]|nr:hypothetical protein BC832DRAFT_434011 [Gaertneriomyces semiglobifer]
MVFKPGILFSLVCQGLLVCIAAAAGDSSYTWPNGNFRYLVPFKQGGGSASIAQLHETWFNDPAVNAWQGSTPYEAEMDYVPAESGAAGWRQVKEHPKDGSVITLINLPHIFLQPRLPSVVSDKVIPAGYSEDDIEIAYIHTYTPLVLAVPIDSPILNWADFVAACAAREISVSGAGLGTVFEVGSLRLKRLTNIKFAYHSAGDGADTALTKTIDGVYDAVWTTTPVVLGAHASKIRVIAIAAEFEFAQIEAPTFKTLGINFVEGIYRGVGVPAGTPPHIVKGISDTFNRLNRNRDFISEVASSGATQTFMQFDSQSLNQFLPSYKAQVLNTLFPPNAISPGSIYAFFLLGGLGLLATLAL